MCQTLVFLEWKSKWWLQREGLWEGLSCELDEGLRAVAMGLADLQRHLAVQFQEVWKGSLHDGATENTNTNNDADEAEDDGEGNDNDDDDEEDNDSDNDDVWEGDPGDGDDNKNSD